MKSQNKKLLQSNNLQIVKVFSEKQGPIDAVDSFKKGKILFSFESYNCELEENRRQEWVLYSFENMNEFPA